MPGVGAADAYHPSTWSCALAYHSTTVRAYAQAGHPSISVPEIDAPMLTLGPSVENPVVAGPVAKNDVSVDISTPQSRRAVSRGRIRMPQHK
jgi:hypothetical protein